MSVHYTAALPPSLALLMLMLSSTDVLLHSSLHYTNVGRVPPIRLFIDLLMLSFFRQI